MTFSGDSPEERLIELFQEFFFFFVFPLFAVYLTVSILLGRIKIKSRIIKIILSLIALSWLAFNGFYSALAEYSKILFIPILILSYHHFIKKKSGSRDVKGRLKDINEKQKALEKRVGSVDYDRLSGEDLKALKEYVNLEERKRRVLGVE